MYKDRRIGLGLVTYERPKFLSKALRSLSHLCGLVDYLVIVDDGSKKNKQRNDQVVVGLAPRWVPWHLRWQKNAGVGAAKNLCLQSLVNRSCDFIFLMEDDIEVLSSGAVIDYVEAYARTGIHHLNFAHHGGMNQEGPLKAYDGIELYPACVGAWSFYTAHCLGEVGFFDEGFYNAWEHVELTFRLAESGFTTPFWQFADVENSSQLLREQPGAMQHSVIRSSPDWAEQAARQKLYWESKEKNPW